MRCAGLARSTFYYQASKLTQPEKYEFIKGEIEKLYHQHKGRLGYRRITLLLRKKGMLINHKTVFRLMNELGLKSLIRVKKYRSYRGDKGTLFANVLARNFKANGPNQKWVTDVTEFKVKGERLYLSALMDLYNQEIISYELSGKPVFQLIMNMLQKAQKQVGKNLMIHSDQGWQYQMQAYQAWLKQQGITQSMSRKGNCLDNAVMENFFGTLKSELFYLNTYESIQELKKDIANYITYYNTDRIKLNLKAMSPIEYRAHYFPNKF